MVMMENPDSVTLSGFEDTADRPADRAEGGGEQLTPPDVSNRNPKFRKLKHSAFLRIMAFSCV